MTTWPSPPSSIKAPRYWGGLWVLALAWLASLFIVNPAGNFPLGDDWSFGLSVQNLLVHHEYRPAGWAAMSLLTNVLWGGLFCLPAGFSFTALRVSSLAAALLGMAGAYWLAKQSRQPSWIAGLTAFTLGFNPFYYVLANSFMTDVLFTALMVFTALFLLKYLTGEADADLVIGTILAGLAALSRQLAIAVPLAFAVTLILKRGFKGRHLWRACAPAAVSVGLLAWFQHWMAATGRLPELYVGKSRELTHALTHPIANLPMLAHNTYVGVVYLGIFLLPVLLCAMAAVWIPQKKKILPLFGAALWIMLLTVFLYRSDGPFPPPIGNILGPAGIGSYAVQHAGDCRFPLPALFWKGATGLGLVGGVLLLTFGAAIVSQLAVKWKSGRLEEREIAAGFLLLSVLIYLFPLLATPHFYDRYLVPAIPLLAGAVLFYCPPIATPGRRIAVPVLGVCAALAVFGIGGTRDTLAWNRTRWQALNRLMTENHVKPDQIDGGFEFNGFYLYDSHYRAEDLRKKSWWWVQGDTYVISDGVVHGYEIFQEYGFTHWLPPYTGKIYVLKKAELQAGEDPAGPDPTRN